jgi:aldehyde dehydrogenase (NAD+)
MSVFDPHQVLVSSAHFIGGTYRYGPAELDVKRPSDGERYAGLPIANISLVDEAVENAWHAFKSSDWASRPPRERARTLRRWADLVEADAERLGPLEAVGSTRPINDVVGWDIPYVAEGIRFFAEFADKLGGEVAATRTDHLGMQIADPYGVIGAIAPWNFPLSMAGWKVAPALAAGNAVVLKPSELTPFSVLRLAELAIVAGIPAGIFNVVQGDGATTGDALCRHPKIAKITFTGSTQTGSTIMAACALTGPKPVTLELGGKSPQIVFADAPDLARTAKTIANGITGNAGQVCVSGARLIVHRAALEPLLTDIIASFKAHIPGCTWDADTTLPPIVSERQAQRIEGIVARGRAMGAEVLCGGLRYEGTGAGAYYQPTVLAGVDEQNVAVQEEIFGPVLTPRLGGTGARAQGRTASIHDIE